MVDVCLDARKGSGLSVSFPASRAKLPCVLRYAYVNGVMSVVDVCLFGWQKGKWLSVSYPSRFLPVTINLVKNAVHHKINFSNIIKRALRSYIFEDLQHRFSSDPSPQSFRPSHRFLTEIHRPDVSHLNCSAKHMQFFSSDLSTQFASPSQAKLDLKHTPLSHWN